MLDRDDLRPIGKLAVRITTQADGRLRLPVRYGRFEGALIVRVDADKPTDETNVKLALGRARRGQKR
jgi:hypothetical protein